jgi:ABC-type sugar transport system substrate-binding protein
MRVRTILGTALVALLLVQSGVAQGTQAAEKRLTIGLSFPSLSFAWFAFLEKATKDKAKIVGNVDVLSVESQNQVSKQVADIEDMIVKKVDGVLLVPIEVKAVIPAVKALNSANVPVVTVDRRLEAGVGVQILGHVGADNVEGGRIAARYVADQLKKKLGSVKGTVIELYGTPGAGPAIDRSKGFHEVLDAYKAVTIKQYTANFRREDGLKVMEDVVTAVGKFDAVFGANDEMILGGLEAIKASGKMKVEDVVTVGFDALPDALRAIKDGTLGATIEQFPGKQASTGFQELVDFLRTGKKPATQTLLITPLLITKANLNQAEKSF